MDGIIILKYHAIDILQLQKFTCNNVLIPNHFPGVPVVPINPQQTM